MFSTWPGNQDVYPLVGGLRKKDVSFIIFTLIKKCIYALTRNIIKHFALIKNIHFEW